jgi:hypothetical protein|tara:strand:- start:579 stop:767 length:189 start_codon:yes stop_codon:yes gene_type:complete
MTVRTVDTATYDAFRVTACLSVFLFCITAAGSIFQTQNEAAIRRCINTEATKEECLLTVYGR